MTGKRKYRVSYHYHRHGEKCMSIHYKGKCILVKDIECNVPVQTKWNKTQPKLVMQGWASSVKISKGKAIIS